jgi:hypothetical protein
MHGVSAEWQSIAMADTSGEMETMSEATTRLRAAGYVENWIAEDGKLRCCTCTATYDPAEITVDEVVRFEGPSDPGDEAILFGLTGPCGHRGQYSAAYGPSASAEDVRVIVALGHAPRDLE